ncbi:MAG: Spy/CpxP family protein refolding chaperone [Acidobacteriota bacterium]|nr:Spy/CpxP family protein refolding chaperone [Acidobacteriota bacterium]
MKKIAVIVTLAVLAVLGLNVIAQEKPAAPAQPAAPVVQARRAPVQEALNLTPEQKAKLEEFRKARQAEMQAFAERMGKLRQEMQALRQDGKADLTKMNGLIDEMYKLQAERAKAGFKNAQEREKIFTPEQLEKMKTFRRGAGRMGMGPGMRPMGMFPAFGDPMRMDRGMRMGMRQGMRQGMRTGMRRGMRMGMRMGREMRPDMMRKDSPKEPPAPVPPKDKGRATDL